MASSYWHDLTGRRGFVSDFFFCDVMTGQFGRFCICLRSFAHKQFEISKMNREPYMLIPVIRFSLRMKLCNTNPLSILFFFSLSAEKDYYFCECAKSKGPVGMCVRFLSYKI